MSEFTPTTEQASRAYVTGMRQAFIASAGEHAEEFARFLAARDASVRAAALDEAAEMVKKIVASINLHDLVPDRIGLEALCDDDDCLWWDMTREQRALLQEQVFAAIRALKEEKK